MILKKTWSRFGHDSHKKSTHGSSTHYNCIDLYTGYFLFGIIPLYIERQRNRR